MKSIQIIVSGRVQGVCFRANTQKQAIKLGITGLVRNKTNGDVEIIAYATEEKLSKLIDWCHTGPIMAKVTNVIVKNYHNTENLSDFEIS